MHFHIERAIGALFHNVNVEANAFAIGAKIDSLFAFGVVDFADFDVKNEFKQTTTQVGIGFQGFAKDKVILNGSVVPFLSDLLVSHKLTSKKL